MSTLPTCACGRLLLVHEASGITMCATHDFPTEAEKNGSAPLIILDGKYISDPFTSTGRARTIYDYAHEAHHADLVREAYPEQKGAA